MTTRKEYVEGMKKLRKQSGLPYLNEAELLEKYGFEEEEEVTEGVEELDEASKEELLKRFGKNRKVFKKDDDDADSDAEVADADDEEEEDKKNGKKKESKKEGKKDSSRNDEAITKQKLEANKRVGVDAKVQLADKKLTTVVGDKDDKKGAAVKPAGDDVKATVEAITPTKLAADQAAGADPEVVLSDPDLLPQAKFVSAVKEALMSSGAMKENLEEDSHKMDETLNAIAETVHGMLKATFNGPQQRREALRETVNKNEIRKETMVHETKGVSRLGERLNENDTTGMYEADTSDMIASIEQENGNLIAKLAEGKY